jgi:hypothetical protein
MFKSFRTALMMLILGIAASLSFSVSARAQTATPPPPSTPPTSTFNIFGGDNASQDNTKKNLEQWRAAFKGSECWGCQLFSTMATVTMQLGQDGSRIFAANAKSAVSAFMSLWVVWQLYLMLSISHANSPAQSIDTIFNRLVIMMVVLFLLSGNTSYTYIMRPVLDTLGGIMDASSSLIGGAQMQCTGVDAGNEVFIQKGSGLLCAMHNQMNDGMALGAWLIDGASFNVFYGQFEILRVLGGVILMAVFGFMLIIMPFRFFDALVRIATISVILPVVILAYLFKPTRGAVKQAATSLLAAALTFLFTAIAIAIAVKVLQAVTFTIIHTDYDKAQLSVTQSIGVGPIDAPKFMILIAAAIGMATMILQAGNLAQEFAGFQGQMGSAGAAGAAAAAGTVMMAAKYGGGAVGSAGARMGGAATSAIRSRGSGGKDDGAKDAGDGGGSGGTGSYST